MVVENKNIKLPKASTYVTSKGVDIICHSCGVSNWKIKSTSAIVHGCCAACGKEAFIIFSTYHLLDNNLLAVKYAELYGVDGLIHAQGDVKEGGV